MNKILLILMVLGYQPTLTACTIQRVPVTPLTETERQALGTIGIAAEVSRLETLYSRDASIIDDGLRAIEDRVDAFGEGALEGVKNVKGFTEVKNINCRNWSCLLLLAVIPAEALARGIAGGVVGVLDEKRYPDLLLMELPERATIRAVQELIDALGLPERLRDEVLKMAQKHTAHHFDLVSRLPGDPPSTQDENQETEAGMRYWALRDKGIHTVLKVRIPLIEFRGSEPDEPYQLLVHVETTLLHTDDGACIRHNTWDYQGSSHRLAEWNNDHAKLFVDELDRGFDLVARRVTPAFFEKHPDIPFDALMTVIPKSESLTCHK